MVTSIDQSQRVQLPHTVDVIHMTTTVVVFMNIHIFILIEIDYSVVVDAFIGFKHFFVDFRFRNIVVKGPGATVKPTTTYPRQKKENTTTKKYPVVKYKSLSYLSFVTRFIIALRVPELELAGVDPKETLEYIDENGYLHPKRLMPKYFTSKLLLLFNITGFAF
jgi:hypothetical protein